ncbi:TolC family protein [Salinispira pacifica]
MRKISSARLIAGFTMATALFLAAGAATAQQTAQTEPDGDQLTIDIDTAVGLALHSNLGLETEQLKLALKRNAKNTVWNQFIPVMSVSANLARWNAEQTLSPMLVPVPPAVGGVYDTVALTPSQTLPRWALSTRVSASLTLTAQMFYGIKQTVLDYNSGKTSLEKARVTLERDVRKQFYNLLLLQRQIALQRDAIKTAQERLDQTKVNYDNGLVDEYTYLSAQVSLANLKPALEELSSAYDTALMAFDQMLGIDLTARPTLEGTIGAQVIPISTKDADKLIVKFVDRRYDIVGLKEAITSLRNVVMITKSGMFPTLTFSYSADPTFMGDPFKDPWFADINRDWKQQSGMFSISIGLRLDPLLPASQTRVKIGEYENQIEQTQVSLTQARQGAEIEIRRIVQTLEKTRNTLDVKKMNSQLAQRALSLAQEGYRAGTRDLLDVRNAEQDLQKAQVDVLSDEYNYTAGLLDLEYALNATLDEIRGTINGN